MLCHSLNRDPSERIGNGADQNDHCEDRTEIFDHKVENPLASERHSLLCNLLLNTFYTDHSGDKQTCCKCGDRHHYRVCKEIKEITEEILFDLPNKWQWCRIGTIFMHNNGKQLNKGNSKGKLMKYITTSNLYWDGFVLDNLKEMPFEENEIERCMAVKGDLLVCEGGDIGRSCIWNYDFPIMLQNHIHKLRSYIPICTKFFYYIFNLYKLTGLIGGKGIGIQGFSSKALHNTLMPLPPLKEQYRIVAQIEKLFEQLR